MPRPPRHTTAVQAAEEAVRTAENSLALLTLQHEFERMECQDSGPGPPGAVKRP
jgi:hypothetical protein